MRFIAGVEELQFNLAAAGAMKYYCQSLLCTDNNMKDFGGEVSRGCWMGTLLP